MSRVPATINQTAGVTKWHAHLSAIPENPVAVPNATVPIGVKAAPNTRAANTSRPSTPRRLGDGVTLDFVDQPVTLRHEGKALTFGIRVTDAADIATAWMIRQSEKGVYALVALSCDMQVVQADPTGRNVSLALRDADNPLQQWTFAPLGDMTYRLRVAGKEDDKVFLGVDDDGSVRLFSKDNSRSVWNIGPVDACIPPKPKDATTPVPSVAVKDIAELTEKQIDTVLQLVSLPENGHPRWYDNYGYIEFLGDGRGFTVTLYGACSGTGDLYMILEELSRIDGRSKACDELLKYAKVMKTKRGDDIRGIEPIKDIIPRLARDAAWQQAVWKVYIKLYWRFALDFAAKRGACARRPGPKLTTAAARGFMLDTAINHGADLDSFMKIVKRMTTEPKDERDWVTAFADAREKMLRSGYEDLDTSKTGDRCRLWKGLFKDNPDLRVPIEAYKGYWGKYSVT